MHFSVSSTCLMYLFFSSSCFLCTAYHAHCTSMLYLRQRASWNSLLFITNPRLAIGRVVSHDDVHFADWDTHINKLSKKLSCATGILNRIKDNIPSELHTNLYHTLFESHLAYGITAWGGVSDKKLQYLFKVQKRCLRILFGDKETNLNKFKTCCRVRPYNHQKLENSFYEKEHSKPIFNEKFIMTVHNLYMSTIAVMKH